MEDDEFDGVRLLRACIPNSDEIFGMLQELPWQKIIWGRTNRPLPRLCLGEVQYLPIGRKIIAWLTNFFFETMGVKCQVYGIFGNNYRTGNDWLPDHHDDQYKDERGRRFHVVSLSFGATRMFHFVSNKIVKMELFHGDILIFSPEQDDRAKHGIEKQPRIKEQRINLTCFCIFEEGDPYKSEFIDALIPPFL